MNLKRFLPYIISFILLIAALIVNQKTLRELNEYTDRVDHTRVIINTLEKVSDHLKSAAIYTSSYSFLNKPIYKLYKQDTESIREELASLKVLTKDNAQQQALLDTLSTMIEAQLPVLIKKNIVEIINDGEGWRLDSLYIIHEKLNKSSAIELALLSERKSKQENFSNLNRVFTVVFSIIALGLTLSSLIFNLLLSRKRQWLEGFLESVLNTSQNGIINFKALRSHDAITDFKIAFANAAIQAQLGLSPSKLIGSHLSDINFIKKNSAYYDKLLGVIQTGKAAEFEMLYELNNKKEFFCITLAKMEDGITATLQNITPIKQYQDQLTRNIQQLETSNKELEQYAYVASHDLQEPLRKIRSYSGFLLDMQKDKLNDKGKMHLEKIIHAAERLSNLIKDILNFSSLKRQANFELVNLNETLANVLEDIDLTIEQSHATITKQPLPQIEALPLQMNQLFF